MQNIFFVFFCCTMTTDIAEIIQNIQSSKYDRFKSAITVLFQSLEKGVYTSEISKGFAELAAMLNPEWFKCRDGILHDILIRLVPLMSKVYKCNPLRIDEPFARVLLYVASTWITEEINHIALQILIYIVEPPEISHDIKDAPTSEAKSYVLWKADLSPVFEFGCTCGSNKIMKNVGVFGDNLSEYASNEWRLFQAGVLDFRLRTAALNRAEYLITTLNNLCCDVQVVRRIAQTTPEVFERVFELLDDIAKKIDGDHKLDMDLEFIQDLVFIARQFVTSHMSQDLWQEYSVLWKYRKHPDPVIQDDVWGVFMNIPWNMDMDEEEEEDEDGDIDAKQQSPSVSTSHSALTTNWF